MYNTTRTLATYEKANVLACLYLSREVGIAA